MTARMSCEQVEVLLGARMADTLGHDERAAVDAHVAACEECSTMVNHVGRIVADARVLPELVPLRDLWPDIASRLGAQEPVDDSHVAAASTTAGHSPRAALSWQPLAAAAVLLVSVTAAVTWNLAQRTVSASPVPTVASLDTILPDADQTDTSTDGFRFAVGTHKSEKPTPKTTPTAQLASGTGSDVEAIYENEIAALRTIVDERFSELDSSTVAELRKNLEIIDRAIMDSRDALRRDPRSLMLTRQLDRALEHKLELLRRVALL